MMSEYIVIEASTIFALVEKVNKAIKDGYEPLGGVSEVATVNADDDYCYYSSQAMYKKESLKESISTTLGPLQRCLDLSQSQKYPK